MPITTLVLVVIALPVLFQSVRGLRRETHSFGEVVYLLSFTVLATLIATQLFSSSPALSLAVAACAAGGAVLMHLGGTGRTPTPDFDARWILMLITWVVLFAVNSFSNGALGTTATFSRVLPLVLIISALVVATAGGYTLRAAASAMMLGLALVTVLSAFAARSTTACTDFKCTAFGEIQLGIYSSGNRYGLVAVLSVALFVATRRPGDSRLATLSAIALVVGVLATTNSRTSGVAFAAAVGVAVVGHGLLRVERSRRGDASPVAWLYLFSTSLVVMVMVVGVVIMRFVESDTLSTRGTVWQAGMTALEGKEVFGLGLDRWAGYPGAPQISYHYPHSWYLLIFFSGGVLALICLMVFLLASLRSARSDDRDFVALLVFTTCLMVAGLAEIVYNPLSIDGFVFTILPFLARFGSRDEADDGAEQAVKSQEPLAPAKAVGRIR